MGTTRVMKIVTFVFAVTDTEDPSSNKLEYRASITIEALKKHKQPWEIMSKAADITARKFWDDIVLMGVLDE